MAIFNRFIQREAAFEVNLPAPVVQAIVDRLAQFVPETQLPADMLRSVVVRTPTHATSPSNGAVSAIGTRSSARVAPLSVPPSAHVTFSSSVASPSNASTIASAAGLTSASQLVVSMRQLDSPETENKSLLAPSSTSPTNEQPVQQSQQDHAQPPQTQRQTHRALGQQQVAAHPLTEVFSDARQSIFALLEVSDARHCLIGT